MIWCRFQSGDGISYGRVEGETVTAIDAAPWETHRTGKTYKLGAVKLAVPVIPPTFYCAGVNYRDHVIRMAKKRGAEPQFPPRADIGYRANNALIATEEAIVKPKDSGVDFQYEGELVAVFGKRCHKVSKAAALDYIFGWTIGNDVSERTWQRTDRTLWRAKNADTFKPMGPWIATGLDPKAMRTKVRLNGREVENFATGDMIFDAATFISETSQYVTFVPGDIMWLGTDGVPENMKVGDVCEVEITGIGVLRNPIVGEK
jgi:2-keto-4-pentenoate hydratase/2-oxohepta-3-ene-1,7-dioic acid hydratase in catechol pathway